MSGDAVAAFMERLSSKPGRKETAKLSAKTRRNIFRVLKAALGDAIDRALAPADCLRHIKEPRAVRAPIETWSPDETQAFMAHVQKSSYLYPLYLLAVATGMRRGELAGLKWTRVDLEQGLIRIEETRLAVKGGWQDDGPKTPHSKRPISLGPSGIRALRIAMERQDEVRRLLGDEPLKGDYVFTGPTGTPPHPDSITHRFKRDCHEAKVRYIKLKGLRHTFITTALMNRINPKVVTEVVGHSNVQTTMSIYSQFVPGAHEGAMVAVEEALLQNREES
jgi:integrase